MAHRKAQDKFGSVLQRDERAAVFEWDRRFELADQGIR
jgi:hypothetical protein